MHELSGDIIFFVAVRGVDREPVAAALLPEQLHQVDLGCKPVHVAAAEGAVTLVRPKQHASVGWRLLVFLMLNHRLQGLRKQSIALLLFLL